MTTDPALAFDREPQPGESARQYDIYGRLHVALAHISKAAINNYRGREIPGWQALGLDGERIYKLLRDPDELARAAPSFNNIPVMSRHVAHTAADHKPDLVIGSTGSHAAFEFPYLNNNLTVWAAKDIEKIEDGLKRELSCSYAYKPDMTPGSFQGAAYDGRMTEIVGNHVAVVVEGRAGPDVLIGDSKPAIQPQMEIVMTTAVLSRKALFVHGASLGYLRGKLAADAKPDLTPVFEGVTHANFVAKKPSIVAALVEATKGKLAPGASIDDFAGYLGAFDEVDPPDEKKAEDEEETDAEKEARLAKEKAAKDKKAKDAKAAKDKAAKDEADETEEEKEAREKREAAAKDKAAKDAKAAKDKAAKDAEPDPITKEAMDEAIESATKLAETNMLGRMRAAREAEAFVRPWVGTLAIAYDSAEEIERAAAVYLKIPDAKTVHASALRPMIKMMPKAGERQPGSRLLAADARPADDGGFAARYPNAAKIRNLG